jgi:hypothetical protein
MNPLINDRDRNDALNRLIGLRAESDMCWRRTSSPGVIAYSSDAFRMALGEEHFSVTTTTTAKSREHPSTPRSISTTCFLPPGRTIHDQ